MTFERSTDYPLITRLLTDPKCWRRMVDDAAPDRLVFEARPHDGMEYIVMDHAAVFLLLASGEVHFCIVPHAWGDAERIAREFLGWVWTNTAHTRLIGPVPRHNRLALRLAKAVGFEEVATEPAAIQRHGQPCDRVVLEMVRPL